MSTADPPPESGPGATNSLVDVPGLRVGQAGLSGDGWLTGTTVVLAPPLGAVAGVDVRGGAPGTRETDLLNPRNLVERVHAVVLSGGSAFGLASVDGVVQGLADDGVGLKVGAGPDQVVPIVPAAIIFDLGRGGAFRNHPGAELGRAAYHSAKGPEGEGSVRQGCV
ncbi:MAG: P1 family peptidase, partial [Acidimicrobiales bacterium]